MTLNENLSSYLIKRDIDISKYINDLFNYIETKDKNTIIINRNAIIKILNLIIKLISNILKTILFHIDYVEKDYKDGLAIIESLKILINYVNDDVNDEIFLITTENMHTLIKDEKIKKNKSKYYVDLDRLTKSNINIINNIKSSIIILLNLYNYNTFITTLNDKLKSYYDKITSNNNINSQTDLSTIQGLLDKINKLNTYIMNELKIEENIKKELIPSISSDIIKIIDFIKKINEVLIKYINKDINKANNEDNYIIGLDSIILLNNLNSYLITKNYEYLNIIIENNLQKKEVIVGNIKPLNYYLHDDSISKKEKNIEDETALKREKILINSKKIIMIGINICYPGSINDDFNKNIEKIFNYLAMINKSIDVIDDTNKYIVYYIFILLQTLIISICSFIFENFTIKNNAINNKLIVNMLLIINIFDILQVIFSENKKDYILKDYIYDDSVNMFNFKKQFQDYMISKYGVNINNLFNDEITFEKNFIQSFNKFIKDTFILDDYKISFKQRGGNNKYKKTDNKITFIYKKKQYTKNIYINELNKYVKINKTFMLLSKLKKA